MPFLQRLFVRFVLAASVAGMGLGATYWLARQQHQVGQAVAQARFNDEVRSSADALAQRMAIYTEIVSSARDIFLINPDLEFEQFNQVAQAHDFRSRYPELRNLSFARWVPHADLSAFEARLSRQARLLGMPEQNIIHPLLDIADHYIIEYLWPFERNQGVWGLDIASQAANLTAVERGRQTGQITLSAPFALIQEADHPQAVVLRGPVVVPPQRFLGSVTVTLRVSEMLDAVKAQGLFNNVALHLQDVGALDAVADGPPTFLGALGKALPAPVAQEQGLEPMRRMLEIHGRRWRLEFMPARSMLSAAEEKIPQWIGMGGVLFSLLLGLLTYLLLQQRALALWKADHSLQELQRSEARFRAIFNQAAVGVSLIDIDSGRYLRLNQRYCDMLGYSAEELLTLGPKDLTVAEDWPLQAAKMRRLQVGEITYFRLEKRMQQKNGGQIWVDLTVSSVHTSGSEGGVQSFYIGVLQDISERRRSEQALQDNEQRMRTILDNMPVGVLLVGADDYIEFRNQRFVAITGYGEDLLPSTALWWGCAYPQPQQRERIQAHWMALIEQAKAGDGAIRAGEYPVRCVNGQTRILDISGLLLGDKTLVFFEDMTAHRVAEEEVHYLAHHDTLTGLPNRSQLLEVLRQALAGCAREGRCGALLLLDLDYFKTLNETRGHEWGDKLLCQVAERLRHCMQEGASLARHGDDEFVVLLEDLGGSAEEARDEAQREGDRLLHALRAPYMLGPQPYHGTVSMGVVIFHGVGQSAPTLLAQADLAMNQAKTAGRNALCFYDPRVQAVVQERAALEQELRRGLQEGQFTLYYQAQVHRPSADAPEVLNGCEVLLRWRHPQKGFISPATFVPLAEESGFIVPLGQWVLESACAQLARWADDSAFAHITVAVNVSARQFHQSNFVQQVLMALAGSGANPQRLELELTEGLLLQDVEDTIAKMQQLRSYGVRFSLDDFGTGYSSLAYLKRLPLDQLKIDQGFVRDVLTDPNDAAIARTIAALGATLGLHVVAEGVETEAQRDFLEASDCRIWQGYFFSRPVPVQEFEALAQRYRTPPPTV